MKRINIQIIFFAWVLLTAGAMTFVSCSSDPPEGSKAAQAQKGKVFFKENCGSCHGEFGKGDGLEAKNLEKKVADLTRIQERRRAKQFPIVEIARIIDGRDHLRVHGPRDMPTWGKYFAEEEQLTDEQIRGKMGELIAYLMQIQEFD